MTFAQRERAPRVPSSARSRLDRRAQRGGKTRPEGRAGHRRAELAQLTGAGHRRAELAKLIGVRVRVGDPLANVKVAKKVDRELPLGSMAAAIGLGIEPK